MRRFQSTIPYLFLLSMLFCSFVQAKKVYVQGVQKITFRTGPGVDHKIIKMLETNDRLTLVSEQGDWVQVKTSEDEQGYVLKRFVSEDVPAIYSLRWLRKQYNKLKEENDQLSSRLSLEGEKKTSLETELQQTKQELARTQKSYTELKEGSERYLDLKKRYDTTQMTLSSVKKENTGLEKKMDRYYMGWFALGAGVLLLGFIIGKIGRRKYMYDSKIKL